MGSAVQAARVAPLHQPARDGWRPAFVDVWQRRPGSANYLGNLVLLVVAYYAAAHLGYGLAFSGPVAAIVWLPVGVAIAFLYLRGLRFWPGVVAADLLVNNYSALPVGSALGQTFGNVLEVLVAAYLLGRLSPRGDPLGTLRGVAGVIVALAAGTLVSAAIGPLSLWLGDAISARSLAHVGSTWWLGDFSGALIVVPLALSWSKLPPRMVRPAIGIEAALTLAAVAGISAASLTTDRPIRFLAFPALIWAALRFGSRGATVAITIVSGIAIWATTHFTGPWASEPIGNRVLDTQMFIAAVSLSALAIAALVSERERLIESVRGSRARLVAASDETRQQIERDLHDGAQQALVAIRLKVTMAREAADPRGLDRQLGAIDREAGAALEELRALVHGIYPRILREMGIAAALHAAAERFPLPVRISDAGIGRLPEAIEAAIYFCIREALQNTVKYAGAGSKASVTLAHRGRTVEFTVSDNGPGMTPEQASKGIGIHNMRDRLAAVGGRLEIVSGRGQGTLIHGTIAHQAAGTSRTRHGA